MPGADTGLVAKSRVNSSICRKKLAGDIFQRVPEQRGRLPCCSIGQIGSLAMFDTLCTQLAARAAAKQDPRSKQTHATNYTPRNCASFPALIKRGPAEHGTYSDLPATLGRIKPIKRVLKLILAVFSRVGLKDNQIYDTNELMRSLAKKISDSV